MSLLDEYIKFELTSDIKAAYEANLFVKRFVTRFSRDSIKAMRMNDYLFKPDDYGNESSFCRQLMYSPLASMGNCFPSIFGLYLKGGVEFKLSKTYAQYGTDYENAFIEIKSEIVDLLNAGDDYDYEAIEHSRINSAFKNILLAVYHYDKFLPAPTHTALNAYCEALGFMFPAGTTMLYKNHKLVEWMKNVPECEQWDTFILMRFCDWLWRSGKKIDGKQLTENILRTQEKAINDELERLDLKGETREAIVKVRINQSEFRERLLNRYGHCCLCGVANPALLVASHIKPWAASEPMERLDIDNGLIMCPNHDKLFDRGFITFNEDGEIMISSLLDSNDQIFLNANKSMRIDLTEKNRKYMEYHRNQIFKP